MINENMIKKEIATSKYHLLQGKDTVTVDPEIQRYGGLMEPTVASRSL